MGSNAEAMGSNQLTLPPKLVIVLTELSKSTTLASEADESTSVHISTESVSALDCPPTAGQTAYAFDVASLQEAYGCQNGVPSSSGSVLTLAAMKTALREEQSNVVLKRAENSLDSGFVDSAVSLLRRIVRDNPRLKKAWVLLARAYIESGNEQESKAALATASALP